ncbi:MAG TPA: EF-hand domain-containing protein [Gammaproteobacteria bacterium]|nr:EF-hand domain-containing protein [Gammaproteobacteria bacterium]
MPKFTTTLLAVSLLAGAPLALADSPAAQSGETMLQGADRDGDGRLSRSEYDAMMRNHEETAGNHGATTPPAGEGVPATEHQANVIANFEKRDRDGDGYVTAEELNVQDDY